MEITDKSSRDKAHAGAIKGNLHGGGRPGVVFDDAQCDLPVLTGDGDDGIHMIIETLYFLHERLRNDLKLKEKQLQILHGGMSDVEQQEIVEAFGKPEESVRILICSVE